MGTSYAAASNNARKNTHSSRGVRPLNWFTSRELCHSMDLLEPEANRFFDPNIGAAGSTIWVKALYYLWQAAGDARVHQKCKKLNSLLDVERLLETVFRIINSKKKDILIARRMSRRRSISIGAACGVCSCCRRLRSQCTFLFLGNISRCSCSLWGWWWWWRCYLSATRWQYPPMSCTHRTQREFLGIAVMVGIVVVILIIIRACLHARSATCYVRLGWCKIITCFV